MSFKSKMLAGAVALTMVSGVGMASALTAGTAGAATPSCGPACVNVFSHDFGSFRNPNFTMDVWRQGSKVGQPLILFRTSNSDPALDWTVSFQGNVSDFCAAGIITGFTCYRWGTPTGTTAGGITADLPAVEFEYSPFGVQSGLCAGVATTPYQGEGVNLQPCGVKANTVWIADFLDNPFHRVVPLINGANTNFSHPYVLTYPANGYPTDSPRPQLQVRNLTGFSNPGTVTAVISSVNSNQLWGGTFGVLK
jgi:hypothetical protein